MDSCKCPITDEIFEDPVVGDDGHTYERKAITDWLTKNETSPITRQPMKVSSLRPNYIVKKMIEELKSTTPLQQTQYQFQIDVDIRKTKPKPLFQGFNKSIYEVEWINRDGPPIILFKIDGIKASREASFYVQLSNHPHIVRTFGFVQSNPGSIMLLQECAPQGNLFELLRDNGFKPNEQVLWEIFKQICDAMIRLTDNGIVHGDLTCRNVLVFRSNSTEPKENLVKLTDFGLTHGSTVYSMIDSPALTTMTIIPVRHIAPEILRNSDKLSYSEKSDIYSMGVLMWEACSYGQLPYYASESDEVVRKRKLNDERLPQPSLCSHQLWTIMNECWHQVPLNRPTFKILKESLSTLGIKPMLDHKEPSPPDMNHDSDPSSINKHSTLDDIVYIPCEFCNESIPLPYWTLHTDACREQEIQRLDNIASKVSQMPVTEYIPCEYCQKLCSLDQFTQHEMKCSRNPQVPSSVDKHLPPDILLNLEIPHKSASADRNYAAQSNSQSPRNLLPSHFKQSPQFSNYLGQYKDKVHYPTTLQTAHNSQLLHDQIDVHHAYNPTRKPNHPLSNTPQPYSIYSNDYSSLVQQSIYDESLSTKSRTKESSNDFSNLFEEPIYDFSSIVSSKKQSEDDYPNLLGEPIYDFSRLVSSRKQNEDNYSNPLQEPIYDLSSIISSKKESEDDYSHLLQEPIYDFSSIVSSNKQNEDDFPNLLQKPNYDFSSILSSNKQSEHNYSNLLGEPICDLSPIVSSNKQSEDYHSNLLEEPIYDLSSIVSEKKENSTDYSNVVQESVYHPSSSEPRRNETEN